MFCVEKRNMQQGSIKTLSVTKKFEKVICSWAEWLFLIAQSTALMSID